MFGPPGSGKGTQAVKLAAWLQIPSISTGELLRAEVKSGSCLGFELQEILASGRFASDDLVNRIVSAQFDTGRFRDGCILDGYPRTVDQAIFLDFELARRGLPPAMVVELQVPDEVIVERLSQRRQCPVCGRTYHLEDAPPLTGGECDMCEETHLIQRSDDVPEVIRRRLAIYHEATTPVLEHYVSFDVLTINGERAPAHVFRQIQAGLKQPATLF
jgi:adenylate kinase